MDAIRAEHLPHYKVADYEQWEGDWELIQGIPYSMSPSATRRHQVVAGKLFTLLSDAVRVQSCGCEVYYELDLIIANDTVVRPDLMLMCDDFEGDYPSTPPGVIAEVTSPSTEKIDRALKFELYAEFGVLYYLIVDINSKTIESWRLKDGKFEIKPSASLFQLRNCELFLDSTQLF